jgi:histone H3/H4
MVSRTATTTTTTAAAPRAHAPAPAAQEAHIVEDAPAAAAAPKKARSRKVEPQNPKKQKVMPRKLSPEERAARKKIKDAEMIDQINDSAVQRILKALLAKRVSRPALVFIRQEVSKYFASLVSAQVTMALTLRKKKTVTVQDALQSLRDNKTTFVAMV